MTTFCSSFLTLDLVNVPCDLEAGHDGQHVAQGTDDVGAAYAIRWDQAPATVRGEVTGL